MGSLIPRKRTMSIPVTLCILCTAFMFLIFPLTHPGLQGLLLPPCGHIVLISAARHGSSWFLNCAEGCTAESSFEPLNLASELWNDATEGPVQSIEPRLAGKYAESKHSIKVFPLAYFRNNSKLGEFFDEVKKRKVPVFVLTRTLNQSFASLRAAKETDEWNVNSAKPLNRAAVSVEDGDGLQYATRISTYFVGVREMLMKRDMVWDEFVYDDVVGDRVIVGELNQCSIRNCNSVM